MAKTRAPDRLGKYVEIPDPLLNAARGAQDLADRFTAEFGDLPGPDAADRFEEVYDAYASLGRAFAEVVTKSGVTPRGADNV